jgi:hypothetical protein
LGGTKGEPSRFSKMADKIYNEASHVEAVEGRVTVEGPDGVDVALTPDAAMETSDRLFVAAAEARGQEMINLQRSARLEG